MSAEPVSTPKMSLHDIFIAVAQKLKYSKQAAKPIGSGVVAWLSQGEGVMLCKGKASNCGAYLVGARIHVGIHNTNLHMQIDEGAVSSPAELLLKLRTWYLGVIQSERAEAAAEPPAAHTPDMLRELVKRLPGPLNPKSIGDVYVFKDAQGTVYLNLRSSDRVTPAAVISVHGGGVVDVDGKTIPERVVVALIANRRAAPHTIESATSTGDLLRQAVTWYKSTVMLDRNHGALAAAEPPVNNIRVLFHAMAAQLPTQMDHVGFKHLTRNVVAWRDRGQVRMGVRYGTGTPIATIGVIVGRDGDFVLVTTGLITNNAPELEIHTASSPADILKQAAAWYMRTFPEARRVIAAAEPSANPARALFDKLTGMRDVAVKPVEVAPHLFTGPYVRSVNVVDSIERLDLLIGMTLSAEAHRVGPSTKQTFQVEGRVRIKDDKLVVDRVAFEHGGPYVEVHSSRVVDVTHMDVAGVIRVVVQRAAAYAKLWLPELLHEYTREDHRFDAVRAKFPVTAAAEPQPESTFEGDLSVLFKAIADKLKRRPLKFKVADAPVTLRFFNAVRLVLDANNKQVGQVSLVSERYTPEQVQRYGVKSQHDVYVNRMDVVGSDVKLRGGANITHYRLPAQATSTDLLKHIVREFAHLCKSYPLPKQQAEAAAEPQPQQSKGDADVAVFKKILAAVADKTVKLPDITYVRERIHGSRQGDRYTYSAALRADVDRRRLSVDLALQHSDVELDAKAHAAVREMTAVIREMNGGHGLIMEVAHLGTHDESLAPVGFDSADTRGIVTGIIGALNKVLDSYIWHHCPASWERNPVRAAAEPPAAPADDSDVCTRIMELYGTKIPASATDFANPSNMTVVWELPVIAKYADCTLRFGCVSIDMAYLCVERITANNVRVRRMFTFFDAHKKQGYMALSQLSDRHKAKDIPADEDGKNYVKIDDVDPIRHTFALIAAKAMRLVHELDITTRDAFASVHAELLAAGGRIEHDKIRLAINPNNTQLLTVSFQDASGSWSAPDSVGVNTSNAVSVSLPRKIYSFPFQGDAKKLIDSIALLKAKDDKIVRAAAEPQSEPVNLIDVSPANRKTIKQDLELGGARLQVQLGTSGTNERLHVLVTNMDMLERNTAANPNVAYNVVFDAESKCYTVSTSWDKQQRSFSKIPARPLDTYEKLVQAVVQVTARHATKTVFPRRNKRHERNS